MTGQASILIVDDRSDKVLALEAVLENLGQTIVRAYSGRDALRQVLEREFAVILLDVNMPGMDGFDTAMLIRQRKNSEHVPIIFITAFGDEMHAARGYSLGAVDYILAPVIPEVLRTKVSVFVDLFLKTEQLKRQAEFLRQRADQLHKVTAASLAINSAVSIDQMLKIVTDTAREITGAHQAKATVGLRVGLHRSVEAVSLAPGCESADKCCPELQETDAWRTVIKDNRPVRLTRQELESLTDARPATVQPLTAQGWLAAPFSGRDGRNMGLIQLCSRDDSPFTNDDEAVVVQLAQMASIAIENAIFSEEREANRVKDEFLATLSHELRTPLNAILGWTQLLKVELAAPGAPAHDSPDGMAHGLDVIERNARSQTKLIEDLLDVSRIATGKMRLNARPSVLGPVVQAAADAVRPTLDSKGITAEWSLQAADATVNGDPDRLQQVFWNLLANASKFTPEGGRISVRLERVDDWVRLVVADTGAGIDPKFLPFVFDRFRQGDSSSTRSHGGLGIGLTIVRHVVETHGGTVHADSPGEGLGATFTITLPLLTAANGQTPPAAVPVNRNGSSRAPSTDSTASSGSPHSGSADSSQAGLTASPPPGSPQAGLWHDHGKNGDVRADLSGIRVLVVDDEPDAREMFAKILERAGAVVMTASSARAALKVIRDEMPHVLISDIAMPDRDGYELIRDVRELMPESRLPAIALTAYAREEDRRRAITHGFQTHLTKPIEPATLVEAVACLGGNHAVRA